MEPKPTIFELAAGPQTGKTLIAAATVDKFLAMGCTPLWVDYSIENARFHLEHNKWTGRVDFAGQRSIVAPWAYSLVVINDADRFHAPILERLKNDFINVRQGHLPRMMIITRSI